MFIKTADKRLINAEMVTYFEVTPYLNTDGALLFAHFQKGSVQLYSGTQAAVDKVFFDLTDALVSGRISVFDFTRQRGI